MARLRTFSLLSSITSTRVEQTSDSASSLSITVLCRIKSPITEQSLYLTPGDLTVFSNLTNKPTKAEFINLLAAFELSIIDSKYIRAFSFSFMVTFEASAE